MEGNSRDQLALYYPDIRLEGLSKSPKPLSQNSRCPSRDSNQEISESKSETLMLEPSCFVHSFYFKFLKKLIKM